MSFTPNQTPEQIARDAIDAQLKASGWAVQPKDGINFHEGEGQAVREYTTDTGPADYVLFVDGQPVGVIEAKKETLGANITAVEDQTADYAAAKLKWVQNTGIPLPFLYEATGVITRFTDQRDPTAPRCCANTATCRARSCTSCSPRRLPTTRPRAGGG